MLTSVRRTALALSFCIVAACSDALENPGSDNAAAPGELSVASRSEPITVAQAALARWSPVVSLPLVPVSAANLPDGKVLLWAAEDRFGFVVDRGLTYSATFDPNTNVATERLVNETSHDMFCPGTANLPDGRILVNGGLSSKKTSIFNPANGLWTSAGEMNIARGYQGTTPLSDGSVFTLGGSWRGILDNTPVGDRHGELWTEAAGWRRLSGVLIDPFLSVDPTKDFGMDSHLWLLPTGNGRVFHAGPGINMHSINTDGSGQVLPVGRRGDDEFSVNGNAVMFDLGRVLKVGGGPGYEGVPSNGNSYIIELGTDVNVRKVQSMAYRRAFQNSVVLPNGQVVVIGGATVAKAFSDDNSVLVPELFDPASETFSALPPMSVPRNYHSVAILLPDARVLSAGGGLCYSCPANHPDLQILSPHYLFNADGSAATRPVIQSAPTQANHGTTMTVVTQTPVASFALVRSSSTTHAVNNDQRRLPLTFRATGTNTYAVDVPSNPGWALPGLYMLFALNANGVPSVARTVRIGSASPLVLKAINDQATSIGSIARLALQVTSTTQTTLTYSAKSLPAGLSINASSGVISGSPSTEGRTLAEVSVSDGQQTVSTQFVWSVNASGTTRFVRFEALSEVNNNPWASVAELNLLDQRGRVLSRGGWTVSADSSEPGYEAARAIDGDPISCWFTQFTPTSPVYPHSFTIDLGGAFALSGLRYLPHQDGNTLGTVKQYRILLSADGVNWGSPVSEGDLSLLGVGVQEKTVYFDNAAQGKVATQSSTSAGAAASRAADGNRNGVYAQGSVSATNAEANAWWNVDLGGSHDVLAVRLWNRTDCCSAQLSNFYVLASETPMTGRTLSQLLADASVAVVQVAGTAPATQLVTLSARARYVRVQLGDRKNLSGPLPPDALQLAEVEVYARVNRAPTLAQPAPSALTVGTAANLTLQANDSNGDALTFTAVGLPPGLTLHGSTGVITGVPTTSGSYQVDITVSDGRGGSATIRFTWTAALPLPTVNWFLAPASLPGQNVHYTANATGIGPLQYQWQFGDGTSATSFSSSPEVDHVFAAPGAYIVTMTVRNSEGGASSKTFYQAVVLPAIAGQPVSSSNLALEQRTGLSARLWIVNQDNDSVSVFDSVSRAKLAEISVGSRPRNVAVSPAGRIWVTNKGSSSLSVIDPATLAVVQTISLVRAAQPFGIVFGADGSAYVALESKGQVVKLSGTGTVLSELSVGPNPRQLALTAPGDRLLVARFITPFQPGENTATVQTQIAGINTGGEIVVVNPSTMTVLRTIVLQHSTKTDSVIAGRGVPNYVGAPVVSPDGDTAWVPSKQDNVQRGTLRNQFSLDFQNTVRAISSRINLVSEQEDYPARVDHDNASVASAAAYHPNGVYLFVALETSRQVAVLDAHGKRELFRFDVGRAPQGLAVSPDGGTLYVHNFMDRSVGVYDARWLHHLGLSIMPLTATLSSVATEQLSSQVLLGKQLFYDARDPRLARDSYMSCATCHNDGGHDGRTWDLTGMGEGLRNTVALRGRAGAQGRLHWSGNFDEVQDFEAQIRTLSGGTGLMTDAQLATGTRNQPLGSAKAGVSADLDALAAYVTSLSSFEPSPHRVGGWAGLGPWFGRPVFVSQCLSCHSGSAFTDSASLALHNVGTLKPGSGTRLGAPLTGLDTPTLRDVWSTAPYLHDGSASTLEAAIQAHAGLKLSSMDVTFVAELLRQMGSEEGTISAAALGTGLVGKYFPNTTLSGTAAATRTEAISFDWGASAPAPGVPTDNFSVRWTGEVYPLSSGDYRVQTVSDGGVRVWVNGVALIDNWTAHAQTTDTSAAINLYAGVRVRITVEYYDTTGNAAMKLRWLTPIATDYVPVPAAQLYTVTPATGTGLSGQYFANGTLSGAAVVTRTEAVNFTWGVAAPAAGVPADNFSVRWTGHVEGSSSGSYRFQTASDNGVRVWINNQLLIDNWTDHTLATDTSAPISLAAGQRYSVKVEYKETTGPATVQLRWLPAGASSYVAIPASLLYVP